MVHNDNHTFLFERQIFNPSFFEAIKEMFECMLKANPEAVSEENPESGILFAFMEKLLFDILAMATENKLMPDLTRIYIRMLQLNYTQTLALIDKRILMVGAPEKEQREFFESLISSMDRDVRDINAQILLHCVNKCFEMGNRDYIDTIMNIVFSLIPEDLVKNWLKIHQVLSVSAIYLS
jgi:hypothetical protein